MCATSTELGRKERKFIDTKQLNLHDTCQQCTIRCILPDLAVHPNRLRQAASA